MMVRQTCRELSDKNTDKLSISGHLGFQNANIKGSCVYSVKFALYKRRNRRILHMHALYCKRFRLTGANLLRKLFLAWTHRCVCWKLSLLRTVTVDVYIYTFLVSCNTILGQQLTFSEYTHEKRGKMLSNGRITTQGAYMPDSMISYREIDTFVANKIF